MYDPSRTNQELIEENALLKQRIQALEQSEPERKRAVKALRQKEQQLRDTAEKIPGVIYQFYAQPDGKIGLYYVSESAYSIFGLSNAPEGFFQQFSARVAPECLKTFSESISEAISAVKPWRYEGEFIKDSGESIWFLGLSNPVTSEREILFNGVLLDITDRKHAEKELKDAHSHIERVLGFSEALLSAVPTPVFYKDKEGRYLGCNRAYSEIMGVTSSQIKGKTVKDLWPSEYADVYHKNDLEIMRNPSRQIYDFKVRDKDGMDRMVIFAKDVFRDENGQIAGIVGAFQDITERKHAEAALRESELFLKESHRIARLGGWKANPHTDYLEWTEGVYDIIGEPLDYKPCLSEGLKLFLPEYVPAIRERVANCLITGEPFTMECEVSSKSSKQIWTEVRGLAPIIAGERSYVIGTFQDITERKRAEKELFESVEKYRLLTDNSTDVIWTMALDGRFTYVSPSVKDMAGFTPEEVMAIPLDKYLFKEDLPWVLELLYGELQKPREERSERRLVEVRQYKKDGSILDVEVSTGWLYNQQGEVIGLQGSTRDISSRKKMEADRAKLEMQLLQAQKMEAIGTLSGGIAHDFNNILSSIQGYVSLMQLDLESDHSHHSRLEKIEEQITSGANLTRQLLGFARGGKYEVKTTNPNELLNKSSEVFGRTKKEVAIAKRFQEGIWTIEADRGQIEQTLLNIYINAWQAMPGGGNLYLESQNVILDDADVESHGVQKGRYVKISITDTGIGMDEPTRERIFEPFFTTKEAGKGTGLGLASAYGIIKNHEGFVTVYSEKGKGSTFNIYLPASNNEKVAEVTPHVQKSDTGRETILLVDDEESNVSVTKELLENLGYRVIAAGSGQEAIAIFLEKKRVINLVILDMIMPGMGGGKTFDALLEIDPDVKVILASGYSINGEAQQILDKGCKGFIQKPFRINELSRKIREVL